MSGLRSIAVAAGVWVSAVALPAAAATLGLVADDESRGVAVIDGDTNTVVATIPIPGGVVLFGDTLVAPDQKQGFVTDFDGHVWVIDLAATPPVLASGLNPIPISNPGEDLSISPDGRFLVIVDGSNPAPISVVDVASRNEIQAVDVAGFNSVDVCSSGSVLVTTAVTDVGPTMLRRFVLSSAGVLTDSGESLLLDPALQNKANNVYCAPDGKTGFVVLRFPGSLQSFVVDGLTPVTNLALAPDAFGISGLFHPSGNKLYVRANLGVAAGRIDVFAYDPATGAIGASLATAGGGAVPTYFGVDQMALHPDLSRLYVSEFEKVDVLDATTLAPLGSISDPFIVSPSGIAFEAIVAVCGDGLVAPTEQCDDGDLDPGDGCSATCELECGNGALDGAEQCDDANRTDGDGCSAQCLFEEPLLTLAPDTAENTVGTPHTVTAHVEYALGPLAGEGVLFGVSGANTATNAGITDMNGDVSFTYTGANAGTDSIAACWDLNGDGMCGADEPVDLVTKRWVPVSTSTPGCKIDYRGSSRTQNRDFAEFFGFARVAADGTPSGLQFFKNLGLRMRFEAKSVTVERVQCDHGAASIEGEARVGKAIVPYRIRLWDRPGLFNDRYQIELGNSFDTGNQRLLSGNVEVHVR